MSALRPHSGRRRGRARKAASPWIDFIWRPVAVLPGEPERRAVDRAAATTATRTTFYAGTADDRAVSAPRPRTTATISPPARRRCGWCCGRPSAEPPYDVFAVTADPAEGEGFTEAGNDLVETVPMPDSIRDAVEAFVAEHHVEQPFFKRKRDRADPEALARRAPRRARTSE